MKLFGVYKDNRLCKTKLFGVYKDNSLCKTKLFGVYKDNRLCKTKLFGVYNKKIESMRLHYSKLKTMQMACERIREIAALLSGSP